MTKQMTGASMLEQKSILLEQTTTMSEEKSDMERRRTALQTYANAINPVEPKKPKSSVKPVCIAGAKKPQAKSRMSAPLRPAIEIVAVMCRLQCKPFHHQIGSQALPRRVTGGSEQNNPGKLCCRPQGLAKYRRVSSAVDDDIRAASFIDVCKLPLMLADGAANQLRCTAGSRVLQAQRGQVAYCD